MVKNPPAKAGDRFNPWVGKIPWGRKWQPTPVFLPGESHGRRSLVGYNPRGAWWVTVHGVAKSPTRLSDFTDSLTNLTSLVAQRLKRLPAMRETWVQSLGRKDALEKELAIHSSIRAWEIPWTEEPGGLQSMGSQKSWT